MYKHTLYPILFTALLMFSSALAVANTNTAIATGAWENGANWSTGVAPLATDDVIVPAGKTMTAGAVGNHCASLTIAATGTVRVSSDLSIAGNLTNAGTFFTFTGSTITFNGAATSTITGGGSYTIQSTIVLNMGSAATVLDVKDPAFIDGINSGSLFYFTFIRGTWKMDNTNTLGDAYNSGSNTALTIPYGVVIEVDAGQMNLAKKGTTDNVLLSGELFVNGGTVYIQIGQAFNSGQDFRYTVNGGTPQLYIASGALNVGAGFNAHLGSDYIDFHMTGGTMVVASSGYSDWITFQLADNLGGKTFMSGGLIILQDACNAPIEDLDMGGSAVKASQYSVTGGTVQLGYVNTQAGATFFAINAQPSTNYPNIDFASGAGKTVSAWTGGNINMLSLHVNANMTFDATGFPVINIMSNNGTFAFDDEGGFIEGSNTVTFTGTTPQVISSTSLANENFYNLVVNNPSNVVLAVNSTVTNQLTLSNGNVDASKNSLTIANGSVAINGASSSKYIIVGDGTTNTGYLQIGNLPTNSGTYFPIGTTSQFLPAYVNPASNSGTSFAASVFTGATLNAKSTGSSMSPTTLSNMLNAVWNISQTVGTGTSSISLNWTPAGVPLQGAVFSGAGTSIGIARYTGAGGWLVASGGGNVASQTANSSFSSFTQFAIVDNLFVLADVLSDFNAALKTNKTSQLTWSASDQMGVSSFDVERSTDGTSYTTIATVQAVAGETDYSLIDPNPAPGINYYRLLMHNTTGAASYSAVRTVTLSSTASAIRIYPIPATTTVNVSLENAGNDVSVRLISLTGQVLQSTVTAGGTRVITLNIGNYPAGAYFVQVISQNTVLQTSTVTKL